MTEATNAHWTHTLWFTRRVNLSTSKSSNYKKRPMMYQLASCLVTFLSVQIDTWPTELYQAQGVQSWVFSAFTTARRTARTAVQ